MCIRDSNNNVIPRDCPSKLGAPVNINNPAPAINSPNKFFNGGFSFNIRNAAKTPKGTSNWTIIIAEDASTRFKPENVSPYCKVQATKESINISLNKFLGTGNHQTKIRPASHQRKPLIKRGGSCSIPGLAITKPKPHKQGIEMAIMISFIGIRIKIKGLFQFFVKIEHITNKRMLWKIKIPTSNIQKVHSILGLEVE